MSFRNPTRRIVSLALSLMLIFTCIIVPGIPAHGALNTSIPAPAGGSVDANRIILRVTNTWLTAANYTRWTTDYAGADALSIWYTNDGTNPVDSPTRKRMGVYPAVTAAGALTTPRAYLMDYTGGTTYTFVCFQGEDWSNTYSYTTAVSTPRLSIANNIDPAKTNNVLRLTSGLYKRSDLIGGIKLFTDAAGGSIYYQTAMTTWNPATSQFVASSVDNITAANLVSGGTLYSDANPISVAGVDETNAIAIRAVARQGTANSAAVTFYIRATDDVNFITLKGDKDGNITVDLDAFVAQLTLEEKIIMLGGVGGDPIWLLNGHNYPIESNNDGILRTGGPAGGTMALPRFNIPSTVLADGPAGLRMWKNATIWMAPAGVGASWNADLAVKVGERYAAEAKHYAVDYVLGPGINNQRNPLSGRNFEYYSEDPYVGGYTAANQVKGMQTGGVAATLKHFAANDYETGRSGNAYASERSLREIYLRAFEIAVKEADPWAIMTGYNGINGVTTKANSWLTTQVLRDEWGFSGFVMTDWGSDNGTASLVSQNDMIQGSSRTLSSYTTWANTPANMALINRSVKNVLGVLVKTFAFQGEYGVLQTDGSYADGAKLDGTPTTGLTNQDIGLRHNAFGDSQVQKDSRVVNKQVADEAIVLLRNENDTLPLKGDEKVALVTSRKAWNEFFNPRWYGDSASVGDVVIQGTGSAQVRFNNSTADYALTLKEALEDRGFAVDWQIDFGILGNNNQAFLDAYYNNLPAQGGKKYVFSQEQAAGATAETAAYNAANGVALATARANTRAAALAAAAANDVGIFVLTRISGEGSDVTQALFNIEAKELLVYEEYERAFHDAGKPFIVLLNVGGTTSTTAFRGDTLTIGTGANAVTATTDGADAIVDIWNPGSAGTEAVADILKGAVNPSGRLAQTFPINFNHSPSVYLFAEKNAERQAAGLSAYPGNGYNSTAYYADGVYVGYRFYESRPQNYETMVAYPFGYGLSYTKFEYSDLALSKKYVYGESDTLTASVKVKNVGAVAGKEVVQLYLGANTWQEEGRPKNELRAYGKTKLLAPGEEETITLNLKYDDFVYFDDANPNGTLTPTPTFGIGDGWTVADDTVFTVTVRTNGSDAEKPNQPIQGLTDLFVYGGDDLAVKSFNFGGDVVEGKAGIYDYDFSVPKTKTNITAADFAAANVTAVHPDDVNVSVALSPASGAVSAGAPCVATVTVASKDDPLQTMTYTVNFGYMSVAGLDVASGTRGDNISAAVRFSDGSTSYRLIYAVYDKDGRLVSVTENVIGVIGKNQSGIVSGSFSTAGVADGNKVRAFLWDQDYTPLTPAYESTP